MLLVDGHNLIGRTAGLSLSRELMREMLRLGLPIATELLQPMAAGYFDDLLSCPARGGVFGDAEVHDPASVVGQDDQYEQHMEANS